MDNPARWKWLLLLVVTVVALATIMVYPPSKRLRLGTDLQGGTTLIYEVDVPSGADTKETIEQTIEVLKNRVDPNGVMNLVWRRLAGNRFEVQMPAAPKNVKTLNREYLEANKALLGANLSRGLVERALRLAPSSRQDSFKKLANGDAATVTVLVDLAEAYDAEAVLRSTAEQAEREHRDAELRLEQANGTSETDRQSLEAAVNAKLEELIPKTDALLSSRKKLGAAWQKVLATNVDPAELDAVLSLSDGKTNDPSVTSPRQEGLAVLTKKYPGRAAAIANLAQRHAEYARVKGPLDDHNDLIALLRGSGVLEFRIAPGTGLPKTDAYRTQLSEKGPRGEPNDPYRWFLVDDLSAFADTGQQRQELLNDPAQYFARERGLIGDRFADQIYLLLHNDPESTMTQADEWELASAFRTIDDTGFPAVSFSLSTTGGQHMSRLTTAHQGKPMAIVLDGRVISAPSIRSTIGRHGIITGGARGFSPRELDYLIRTLNAGSLQARVSEEPIYVQSFDATFGRDNLERGLYASFGAMIVVAIFMALYYMVNGCIANFALFGNMVLILGIMSTNFLGATFTLPGIAAIVLTIGMAVDANVLIFERIREELDRGTQVQTALRTGYRKALATIIDANLTTLITCLVLGYTATAEIKGFAVVLGIGILATMFTALLGTRVLLELYVLWTGGKTLHMLPTVVPAVGKLLRPKFDWVGKRAGYMTVSTALIVAGFILVYSRGQNMLDIEFRSGTRITFDLKKGQALDLADVKKRLTKVADQTGIAELAGNRAKVVIAGDPDGTQGTSFTVATLAENQDRQVSQALQEAFADVLDIRRSLAFDKDDATKVGGAPIFTVSSPRLGSNIDRPDIAEDVSEYIGGVAIVLGNMSPPPTISDISQRIDRMRLQPPHDGYGYRSFAVYGLDLATTDLDSDSRDLRYRSAVVLVRDDSTNYLESPRSFEEIGGLADTEWQLTRDAITRQSSLGSVASFSPQVSRTMAINALAAITLTLLAVVAYIWLRFGSLRYGLAAIVALVHDVAIALGIVAAAGLMADSPLGRTLLLSDFKIDLAIVAAILTIVGYSLNDTIVVFDRIRENRGRLAFATPAIINHSINQTISRTTLTSVTTCLALLTLYILGGDGVHGFAFTMLIGVFVGTYSSIAIAAPIVLLGAKQQG